MESVNTAGTEIATIVKIFIVPQQQINVSYYNCIITINLRGLLILKDKTNINEDRNAHHVYIHFSKIIEELLAVSR